MSAHVRHTFCAFMFTVCLLVVVTGGQGGEIDLSWEAPATNADGTPVTDLASYQVYFWQTHDAVPRSVNVGLQTTYTLRNLEGGQTYSIAVTAIDMAGNESLFFNEISARIPADPPVANDDTLTVVEDNLVSTGTVLANDRPGAKNDTVTTTPGTAVTISAPEFVNIWLEAEGGVLQPPMAVATDEKAPNGQFVWVADGQPDLGNPLQKGGVAEYRFTVPADDFYVLWGRTRPNAAGRGSFFVGMDVNDRSAATVTVVTPARYEVASLQVGDVYYLDQRDTIKALPLELAGLVGIKTANQDKKNAAAEFLTFTLVQTATLYVAYDARATRYPRWLTDAYINTGLVIDTTDAPLTVWRREAPAAGPVTLPGNHYGDPTNVYANYIVLLDFSGESAEQYLVWRFQALQGSGKGTVTTVSPSPYEVAPLTVGATYYIDRRDTLTALPTGLSDAVAIQTANDDRVNAAVEFLTFTLNQRATLYVAYDSRATRYPRWLTAAYINTGQMIDTTDAPLTVWRREVSAGSVTLPGNLHGAPVGVGANYIVLIDFAGQSTPSAWAWNQVALDTTPVFFFAKGSHTLRIKQRESGSRLDRLLITSNLAFAPQE